MPIGTCMNDVIPSSDDLRDAAAQLVAALAAHPEPEYRLSVLKRLARRVGEARYPMFLRILGVIAESDDVRAQRLLADTFGEALRRMDLPGGALSSWGATRLPDSKAPVSASTLSGNFFGATPKRLLGPVEYLAVWHLQRTQREVLGSDAFVLATSRMVALLNHNGDARRLYPQKLAVDAQNELEGAYTRTTRERLAAMAASWQAGQSPEAVARAALGVAHDARGGQWVVHDL